MRLQPPFRRRRTLDATTRLIEMWVFERSRPILRKIAAMQGVEFIREVPCIWATSSFVHKHSKTEAKYFQLFWDVSK